MSEQLDLFDAVLGGEQSAQPSAVRQFAVTRRKLASEHGVSQFASSPTPSIWRGGDGELTPLLSAGIKPTQFAASEPKRIQRERRKGWRKPDGAVIVDRTSRYGNPYKVGRDATDNAEAVAMYRTYLDGRPDLVAQIRSNLSGRDLVCFCALTEPCHAEVLLRLANRVEA